MPRTRTIIDCYTDEPAGLGVPPFLGVWPRYIAGRYRDMPFYCTIDDLRYADCARRGTYPEIDPATTKTRKELLNRTRSVDALLDIFHNTDQFVVIAGIQTPGKYLGAAPGSLREVVSLLRHYRATKVLTGPAAVCGTQLRGGSNAEVAAQGEFDAIDGDIYHDYDILQQYMLKGAEVVTQVPYQIIAELETGRGCVRKEGCSFCTEPLKGTPQWRAADDVHQEVAALQRFGVEAFRLGKQSCIYSYAGGDTGALQRLLEGISSARPRVLHIDNANPAMVTEQRTRLFVRYCTPGSTAALGVESFDPEVSAANNLNCDVQGVMDAVRSINRIGGVRGENGCHALLPGINILLGLPGETKKTLEYNFSCLMQMCDEGMLVRRVNIRQVVPFPGTPLAQNGNAWRVIRKNRKLYASWIERVRNEFDEPMLKRLFPSGTRLYGVRSVVHEGNVTFMRQLGSYPIVVGVRQRLPLGRFYSVEITGHMRRSLEAKVVDESG